MAARRTEAWRLDLALLTSKMDEIANDNSQRALQREPEKKDQPDFLFHSALHRAPEPL